MKFERSRDWPLIKAIVTHPAIYPYVGDDFAPDPDNWEPYQDESIWYVLVKDGEEVLGLWAFIPHNQICWDVHTCLLPNARGSRARQAAQELAPWFWENTTCERVITEVPEYNRIALMFAKRAGMEVYGTNPKSFKKDGRLHDLILLGMSRPQAT